MNEERALTLGQLSSGKQEDLIELNAPMGFWLKPTCKVLICCQLPAMRTAGQCVSTVVLIDKLKREANPFAFRGLKVVKSTLSFIRFEAELDSKTIANQILVKLNKLSIKLIGFTESINVKVCRLKMGSTRHEWESFFRDNPEMNEMKPGLRPDTIHVQNLPIKWFGTDLPKAHIVLKTFEVFGEIRRFHIPLLDAVNDSISSPSTSSGGGFKRFSFSESMSFDVYLMFRDYIGFVKAMDTLRGMKLVKKSEGQKDYLEYDIAVDFDKSRHLSDKAIRKRQLTRKYDAKNAMQPQISESGTEDVEKCKQRIKLLKAKKKEAKRLLETLFKKVEFEEKREKAMRNEEEIKKRLLLEEATLREKLLEKRREVLKHQLKQFGRLKSVALPAPPTVKMRHFTEDSILYKNHKQSCKHYKPKSVIVPISCKTDANR